MAGIYLHIPFCKQACSYCNFHFSVSLQNKDAFLHALAKEIELQKNYLSGEEIETVYFGGGTPSLLTGAEVQGLLQKLNAVFQISRAAEITLEANPDDLTPAKISELKATPINRFSIGIQSFDEEELRFLHRAHTAQQAEACVKLAQDAGFENITVDLIYGIPAQGAVSAFEKNLEKLAQLNVPHYSAYCLTVEPRTALEKMIREKKTPEVSDAGAAQQFERLMDFAAATGHEHYEISNFAKPGRYSRHNTAYWQGKKYLGLGPSAHSYDGETRQWNIANNTLYIQALEKGEPAFEKEQLTFKDRFNEYIMLSLRTQWGIDKKFIRQNFGEEKLHFFEEAAAAYLADGFLFSKKEKITLTRKGKLIADRIISDLFETGQ